METDILWQIFNISKYCHWVKLCFIHVNIHDCEAFAKWGRILRNYDRPTEEGLANLSDNEMALWLREKGTGSRDLYIIFEQKREAIVPLVLTSRNALPKKIIGEIIYQCTRHNKLELLKLFNRRLRLRCDDFGDTNCIFHWVMFNNDLEMLQWLLGQFDFSEYEARLPVDEITDLKMLQWVVANTNTSRDNVFIENNLILQRNAMRGKLDVLKWLTRKYGLVKEDFSFNSFEAFRWAADYGHLHVLKWLTKQFRLNRRDATRDDNYAFQHAAKYDHVHVVKWMAKTFAIPKDIRAFQLAVKKGAFSVVRWLTGHYAINRIEATRNQNQAFLDATSNGHLQILKWLVRIFGFTKKDVMQVDSFAFRVSAGTGRLDVLKWLTKRFGVTRENAIALSNHAFLLAARNGHLHILQWLTEQFKLTYVDVAVENNVAFASAAFKGEIEVLRWMAMEFHFKPNFLGSQRAYEWAKSGENEEVVKWMRKQFYG